MDLLALIAFYFTPLLAQHSLLIAYLEQQLGQLAIALNLLRQPVILVLQSGAICIEIDRFGQSLRSNI